LFANSKSRNYNLGIGDYKLNDISINIKGHSITDPKPLAINPSQKDKVAFTRNSNKIKYLKYIFYPLNEDNNDFESSALMKNEPLLAITIEDENEIVFESYLYNIAIPLPGDPLIEMNIVHNNTAPNSDGMFGCARLGTGCSSSTIPNLPKYANKEKVHGGNDVYATLNTPVFAMYSGTIETLEPKDISNK